tara:strand:- start:545 stop:1171 length:627 start_codon:yes stop_codon:yes gene_type:complete
MIKKKIIQIKKQIGNKKLIIVSKYRSNQEIMTAYNTGHRDFGENRVQELIEKYNELPKDIRWHMIGHLQKNKVKYIIPFIHLIHSVDSLKLLRLINDVSNKYNKITNCLIQVKIAEEETKFGFSKEMIIDFLNSNYNESYPHLNIIGLMGMATATENKIQIGNEFNLLHSLYSKHSKLSTLCMGMSQDYKIAIQKKSNMIRIGSYIFS